MEDSQLASSYSYQTFEIARKIAKGNGTADETTSDVFENISKVDLLHNVSCNVEHSGGDITKLGGDHNHYIDDGAFGGHDGPVQEEESDHDHEALSVVSDVIKSEQEQMFTEIVVVRFCVLLEQEEDVNIVAETDDMLLFHMTTLHTSFENGGAELLDKLL